MIKGLDRPSSPQSDISSPTIEHGQTQQRPQELSDDGEEDHDVPKKMSGYNSRMEQIIYENIDVVISITGAGKNQEGGGNYIVYTIRTGVKSLLYLSLDFG